MVPLIFLSIDGMLKIDHLEKTIIRKAIVTLEKFAEGLNIVERIREAFLSQVFALGHR